MNRHALAPAWWLALPVLLTGCQHLPSGLLGDAQRSMVSDGPPATAPLQLPPAARPVYRVGDSFVYGRSSVRTVSALAAGTITWRSGTAAGGDETQTYRTPADLFGPVLDFPGRSDAGRSRIGAREGSLWPLQAGRSARFDEWRRIPGLGDREQRHRWQCEVDAPRMVSVPAGDFATYPVRCRVEQDGFPLAVQQLRWDYAPALGHYVRRSWQENGRLRETVLSAALPGELATPERIARVIGRLQAAP